MDQWEKLLCDMRDFRASGVLYSAEARIRALRRLKSAILAHEEAILSALKADFGKCGFDTYITEVLMVLEEIDDAARHLKGWMKPKRAFAGITNFPSRGRVYCEPFGTALIISPWNYPFMLALSPLVGAVAAGNCAVLKPSSQTPQTGEIISKIVNEALEPRHVYVAGGGHEVSDRLLELPFDFIFFTGSPSVGKRVMRKAAEHLIPIVLELGGKSPCIVDATADLKAAARRIVWGKFVNAGQTCIAPDYLLVERSVMEPLLAEMEGYVRAFYYADGRLSEDFPSIISARHFERLSSLLQDGMLRTGGDTDPAARRIGPAILTDVREESPLVTEEIFGPLLPVFPFDTLDEAIRQVNARPKPLALYFFSTDRAAVRRVLASTSSGGGCINDTIMHVSSHNLPFGGVGNSGMGKYHGKDSFLTFSNRRAILHKAARLEMKLKYPPHGEGKLATLKRLMGR